MNDAAVVTFTWIYYFNKACWTMSSTKKMRLPVIIIFSHKIILFICCFYSFSFKFYLFWLNGILILQKYFYISIQWPWTKSNCIYLQYGSEFKTGSIILYLYTIEHKIQMDVIGESRRSCELLLVCPIWPLYLIMLRKSIVSTKV